MIRPVRSVRALPLAMLALVSPLAPVALAEGPVLGLARPADRTSTVGTLHVERFGRGPRVMVFVAGVVTVDGLPVLPPLAAMTPEQIEKLALDTPRRSSPGCATLRCARSAHRAIS